jgi:GrpB-like predicted nucleotidyltransferase (UPF0157 family)
VSLFEIRAYEQCPAVFDRQDSRIAEVARLLSQMIEQREPRIVVDHIGSTAVAGCGGKGIIDLAVTYTEGDLECAKAVLDALGFQLQPGREPFPETRPMRVAAVPALGGMFRVHAHVIQRNGPEHLELLAFRDALRRDLNLRTAYESEKRQILEGGITDSLEYCHAKGIFVVQALSRIANP